MGIRVKRDVIPFSTLDSLIIGDFSRRPIFIHWKFEVRDQIEFSMMLVAVSLDAAIKGVVYYNHFTNLVLRLISLSFVFDRESTLGDEGKKLAFLGEWQANVQCMVS